ncbi:uncharacterized protein [Aegilops tauschii subsp. strangulata]|uniref:uncharacterized protein n=1 Tax=Aegilops tauschii subsp. strangulata TaxID=200361 RepID=UPI003CC8CA52
MDVLTKIFNKAATEGVISSFPRISAMQRLSIYADDVTLFVKPLASDLQFIRQVLQIFGQASGLRVNYAKSSAILIRGNDADRRRVADMLQCQEGDFPCKYLGLQLAIRQLTHAEWQPMLDHAKYFVPAWQHGLIQRPGRLILVKSMIAAKPVHHFMVIEASDWVFEELDRWMRAFFWKGKEKVNGGQCLVTWNAICRPTDYGGLGIKCLKQQALALRVRWEWLLRTDPNRPWQGLPMATDGMAKRVFDSLVCIKVGNGSRVQFWSNIWIFGFAVIDIVPLIHGLVDTRTRNRRKVEQALDNEAWLQDINGDLSFSAHLQLLHLGRQSPWFRGIPTPTINSRGRVMPQEFTLHCLFIKDSASGWRNRPSQHAFGGAGPPQMQDLHVAGRPASHLDLGSTGQTRSAGSSFAMLHLSSRGR